MKYTFLPLVFSISMFYLLTWFLVKQKVISLLTHRRIWNSMLLLTFLTVGLLGVFLIIRINWGWSPKLPFNMLYWHVEAGITMATISVFHIAWYWRYFASILKKRRRKQ